VSLSVVENSSTHTPLLTIAHGSTDKSIQYGISGRDKDFFNHDFKISAGGGKSELIISSIYIGSTESAKQKVGALVIAKSDQTIDKDGILPIEARQIFLLPIWNIHIFLSTLNNYIAG
jgi:hypothetical protein